MPRAEIHTVCQIFHLAKKANRSHVHSVRANTVISHRCVMVTLHFQHSKEDRAHTTLSIASNCKYKHQMQLIHLNMSNLSSLPISLLLLLLRCYRSCVLQWQWQHQQQHQESLFNRYWYPLLVFLFPCAQTFRIGWQPPIFESHWIVWIHLVTKCSVTHKCWNHISMQSLMLQSVLVANATGIRINVLIAQVKSLTIKSLKTLLGV